MAIARRVGWPNAKGSSDNIVVGSEESPDSQDVLTQAGTLPLVLDILLSRASVGNLTEALRRSLTVDRSHVRSPSLKSTLTTAFLAAILSFLMSMIGAFSPLRSDDSQDETERAL